MHTSFTWIETPVGRLKLCAAGQSLTAILWERDPPGRVATEEGLACDDHPLLRETARQLTEYFAGARTCFDLPLAPQGTPFQQRVWQQLRAIPYGETRTYLELARVLGDTKLTRAVGAANGRNPLSIVVPCHRVIGAVGSLVGFAGGLDAKAYLLAHEGSQGGLFDFSPGATEKAASPGSGEEKLPGA